mgnify:CR=1 FL=1
MHALQKIIDDAFENRASLSPAAAPAEVRDAVAEVAGVAGCEVALVWDPPWDMSRMTDDARMALDIF